MANQRSMRGPHPVDLHVAQRVREQRVLVGMSQAELGKILGVSFQQVQKYESGVNRIGCGRLFDISNALGVSVSYFFDGYSSQYESDQDSELTEQNLRLTRYFSRLTNRQRETVFNVAETFSQANLSQSQTTTGDRKR